MTLSESFWPAEESEALIGTTVGQMARDAAADAPDATALVAGHPDRALRRRWTYAELLRDAERVARALLARFEPGERVAVWAPNIPEWVLLELGSALAGLVLVTVNPAYREQELAYVLGQSRSVGVFSVGEFRGNPMASTLDRVRAELSAVREVVDFADWDDFLSTASTGGLPAVDPSDPVQIQYTSGTTGFPKGAVLHHLGITNNARFTMQRMGIGKSETYAHAMPLFHTGGCVISTLGAMWIRGGHVLSHLFDPALLLELIESEHANVLLGVPTMLIAIMEHPDLTRRDLTSLRRVFSGGATVPAELVRRIESTLGVEFTIVFGQTEASPVITQTRPTDTEADKAESIGQPLPQTEVKIVDPVTTRTVPPGAVGELCTRGYLVMKEYFELPDRTAQAIDEEGWLHTGDLCSMDERGYVHIEGRLKDMIIRGGENIYPREIEELLMTHPTVGEAAVVGIPDDRWGEQVAAFVRPAPDEKPTEPELFAFAREHLAAYKTPRFWVFVDEFPMTPSGKIQKYVLRDRFVTERTAASAG
jgi:fatty-acyl-CoA synthase